MPRLSDTLARRVRPAARDLIMWDDRTPGFGLRVKPSGAATWICDHRDAEGKKRRETIGPISGWACEDAREKVEAIRASAKPAAGPVTIERLAERYLTEHAEVRKKARSSKEDRRLIAVHILPALGDRLAHRLTRSDVASFAADKAATPVQANRLLALLSKMLALAELWEIRPQGSNPVQDVPRFPETPKERYLEDDEWERFATALTTVEATAKRRATRSGTQCIRLILLTGARKTEATTLERSWLDLDKGAAWLPDSKSGAKLLPLPGPAVELLRAQLAWIDEQKDDYRGTPYVFPGRTRAGKIGPISNVQDLFERVRTEAGLPDVTIHTLRHSFGATAVDEGLDIRRLAAIFGHRRIQTTMRYSHARRATVVEGADAVGRSIATRISRPRPAPGAAPPASPDGSSAAGLAPPACADPPSGSPPSPGLAAAARR